MRALSITGALLAIVGFCMFCAVMGGPNKFDLADVAAGGLFFGGLFLFIFARIFQKE